MDLVRSIISRDRKHRLDIERDASGFYRYITLDDRYRDDEVILDPPEWTVANFSGLYDSQEALEADAKAEFDWLGE